MLTKVSNQLRATKGSGVPAFVGMTALESGS
jgi:hypothetical protein